jgi:RNA polymerase sigma-70 factor, ECF subfamily
LSYNRVASLIGRRRNVDRDDQDTITALVRQNGRDPRATEELLTAALDGLRAIARHRLRGERRDHTLQATALVNEVVLRLFNDESPRWESSSHFFAAAAETMRHILLEHARNRGRLKRGGGRERVPLALVDVARESDQDDIEAVDCAMKKLEGKDPDLARSVTLRFYAGLTHEEIALALGSSERTVRRDWKLAQAWLARELGNEFDPFAG